MSLDKRFARAIGMAIALGAALVLGATDVAVPAPRGVKPMLDTVLSVAALFTGAMFFGRFRRSRVASDAGFVYGFALLGLGSLTLAFAQAMTSESAGEVLSFAFAIRAVGFAIVALAALDLPRGKLQDSNAGLLLYGVFVPTFVLVVTLAGLAGNEVQAALEGEGVRTLILRTPDVPWVLSIVNAALAAALALAGYAAHLRATTEDDPFFRRLAGGLGLLAASRIFVLLFPGVPGADIHLGDVLRILGHAALLWAVVEDLHARWTDLARASALAERQRVARELHDGLAQDLALLTAQSSWLSRRSNDSEDLAFVAIVAEHALAESRRTISQLRKPELDAPER